VSSVRRPELPTTSPTNRIRVSSRTGAYFQAMRPVVVPRWIQLVVLPLALLGLWDLARASGPVLLILIAASVIALILNPLVRALERARLPRGVAIPAAYLLVLLVVAAVVFVLANPVATQIGHFSNNVPKYIHQANSTLDKVQRWLNQHGVKIHIKQPGKSALSSLEHTLTKSSGSIVSFSRDVLGKAISFGFDLVLTFVLSIYLLVYAREIGRLVRRVMPAGDGTPGDDFPLLVQRAVSGYVRGQLLFSLVMGASATLALWVFGVLGLFPAGRDYAAFFGAFYGLMEFIPYIGPVIGPIPAVLVALFTNPISAIWVVALFVGLQQLEGHIVAPQVFRLSLRINPILVILALLIGYQLYGIVGALLALPVASVLRQTVEYLQRHLVLERWSTGPPGEPVIGAPLLSAPPGDAQEPVDDASLSAPPGDAEPVDDASLSAPPGDAEPVDDASLSVPPRDPEPIDDASLSALSGNPQEAVDEEGGQQEQNDGDSDPHHTNDRQHQRDHARDAGR
jgi:predicted PurR-regulated permease PerM